jgi:toxin ParE1/3/4
MGDYRLSAGAEAQLDEILDWSEQRFGPAARERYAEVILAAFRSIADDPRQPNAHWRRIRKRQIGVYHIANSRDHVAAELGRVSEPRHYLVFSVGTDGVTEILGFVHDRMLLGRAFRRLLSD